MKQRTLSREVSIKGKTLHTGDTVELTLKPAPTGSGVVFRRVDLAGSPELRPDISHVTDLVRNTTVQSGHAKVHLVEHVLSALAGCGIDNVVVELDGSEPPILDGSARPFVELIHEGRPVEQDKEREFFALEEAVSVTRGASSLIALPHDGLKITCTSADDRGIHTQHLSLEIDPDAYAKELAPARTFTIYEDIEELIKLGKIRGGSLDCAIVLKGDKIISKEPLRFPDEFVRHKILDIVGDITLLGLPLRAHIVAVRPGHAVNSELTRVLAQKFAEKKQGKKGRPSKSHPTSVLPTETSLGVQRILETLPHRYPFLMIDRVIEIRGDDELVAIKNVSFNEPYFQGHFPAQPVMPGVLQIEAMAQAAGVLMLRRVNAEGKVAFFMSCDKVKFRKAVRPGDQLVITAKLTKTRGNKIGVAEARCEVGGEIVSSAELVFAIADSADET
jgi:UDP-3-O-[3-hydroxymyristoyl] N-acetylglucosamine deacetylase/3-hydroxyacyl-[acyl-carrier-protein] dehydratase